MKGKKWSVSARIDNDLHRRFCLVSTRFGVSDTQMITDALTALCDYAIERGRYERPMKMVFDKEQAELLGLAAEPPGGGTRRQRRSFNERKRNQGRQHPNAG